MSGACLEVGRPQGMTACVKDSVLFPLKEEKSLVYLCEACTGKVSALTLLLRGELGEST